jgi:malate dehydrogenase (oxaloacetate-decarboxylating)
MLVAAARALNDCSPARADPAAPLYPAVEEMRAVASRVALAVARQAQRDGLAVAIPAADLERRVAAAMWTPRYPRLVRAATTAPERAWRERAIWTRCVAAGVTTRCGPAPGSR